MYGNWGVQLKNHKHMASPPTHTHTHTCSPPPTHTHRDTD